MTYLLSQLVNESMKNKIERNRILYFILTLVTIMTGLLSRTSIIPELIYPYIGDFLYALMFFFIIGFIFNKREPLQIALITISCCYSIELSQLYQADWINTIRSYKIGGLILGYGFLWSDIVSYTLSGLTGYFFESIYYKQPNKA